MNESKGRCFAMALHSRVVFPLVAALGLVGIIALQVIVPVREAEAKECNNIISSNASKGRCIHTWLGEEVRIDP
jgi:hypothetical protein